MTNNKPENDLISLQMAPVEQHYHTREKVPSPVTMNNLGARLILEGRHGEALRYLSISMKHARALLARHRHRRGSNSADMSCKQVSLPVVEGQQGGRHADTTTNTASTDHSSLEQRQQEQRTSSHSRRLLWFRHHAGAATVDSSISVQQQEARRSGLETLGRLSADACSTTTNEEEGHQLADDFAPNTVTPPTSSQKKPKIATLMTSLASSNSFVYADPIVLDDEPFVCHRHRQCLMKITVTILFNMALAHHLMARSTLTMMLDDESSSSSSSLDEERRNELQRSCRSDLKRAVTLYTLSCRIHVFERLSMNEMIAMAHLNNLGQIHSILGNATLSNAFFEKLLSNLVLYTECYRDNEHRSSRRGRRRLAGFYRNASQVILRGPESAPAA